MRLDVVLRNSIISRYVLLLLLVLYSPSGNFVTATDTMLWYDSPAEHFEETLPLGNGRIGATISGSCTTDRILLNDHYAVER